MATQKTGKAKRFNTVNQEDFDYESINPGYYHDVMLKGRPGQRFWHRKKFEAVSEVIPNKKVTVLDIGCGPGSLFYILRKKNKQAKLIGTDLIESQVNYAKKIVPSATFYADDATKPRFKNADYITMVEVIEHLPPSSERRLFNGIYKNLKKGGTFIITTPNYISLWPIIEVFWNIVSPVKYGDQHINKKTIGTLKRSLEKSGFVIKRVRTLYVLSPFFANLSPKLAEFLFKIEQLILPYFGSVMVIEATKN